MPFVVFLGKLEVLQKLWVNLGEKIIFVDAKKNYLR